MVQLECGVCVGVCVCVNCRQNSWSGLADDRRCLDPVRCRQSTAAVRLETSSARRRWIPAVRPQRGDWLRHLLHHWIVLRSAGRHRCRLQQDLRGGQGAGSTQPHRLVARSKVTSKSTSNDAVRDDSEQPQRSTAIRSAVERRPGHGGSPAAAASCHASDSRLPGRRWTRLSDSIHRPRRQLVRRHRLGLETRRGGGGTGLGPGTRRRSTERRGLGLGRGRRRTTAAGCLQYRSDGRRGRDRPTAPRSIEPVGRLRPSTC